MSCEKFPAWPLGARIPAPAGGAARGMSAAFIPLPAPAPTMELEVADALALSVSGRGAAEAAPQRLTLAARRPPAAGEGHCQQPQHPHAGPPPGTHPRPLTTGGSQSHVGSRGRGRKEPDRRRGPARETDNQ